jgi:hypothetical protein
LRLLYSTARYVIIKTTKKKDGNAYDNDSDHRHTDRKTKKR